jgi:hypothetical protein
MGGKGIGKSTCEYGVGIKNKIKYTNLERHHSIFLYLGMGETYSSLKLFKW